MGAAYGKNRGVGNGRWITSRLLGEVPGLIHGFTTRAAGDFVGSQAAADLLGATGAEELRLLRQVHGARVVGPSAPCGAEERPRADAWAGRPRAGTLLGILTADCLPVLLCHLPSRTLGLAHAGWRGAAAGVATAALEAMGVPAGEVRAALGPAIGPCCYQVGPEVAEAAGGGPRVEPWPGAPGRYRLDLPGLVRDALVAAGLRPEATAALELCTACRPELFYSHRRDRSRGRMCAFLGWAWGPTGP